MPEYTFSRFIYLDTNIVSYFANNEASWPSLFQFLRDEDLTLGIGAGQVAELSDAERLHWDVARFFFSVPTGLITSWDKILAEEVRAHPERRTGTLLAYPLNAMLTEPNGFQRLIQFLSSDSLAGARANQLRAAQRMPDRHSELKSNFPPGADGTYSRDQADEFAELQVLQWLADNHREFLQGFQDDATRLNFDVFLSVRLFGYVIFYKYYLGRRDPTRPSDFGDLSHLCAIPYCELAVMERDLCNILGQIKRNHSILESTKMHDIDFARTFSPS